MRSYLAAATRARAARAQVAGTSMRDEVLEQLRKVEKQEGRGQTGVIDRAGLTWVFTRLDKNAWTPEKINTLLDAVDRKRDGRIKYKEFVDWVYQSTEEEGATMPPGSSRSKSSVPLGSSRSKSSGPGDGKSRKAARAELEAALRSELAQSREDERNAAEKFANLEQMIPDLRNSELASKKALEEKEHQVASLGVSSMKFREEAAEAKRNEDAANAKVDEAEKKMKELEKHAMGPPPALPPAPELPPGCPGFPPDRVSAPHKSVLRVGAGEYVPEETGKEPVVEDPLNDFDQLRHELNAAQAALESAELHRKSEESAHNAQAMEIDRLLKTCDALQKQVEDAKGHAAHHEARVREADDSRKAKEEEAVRLQASIDNLRDEASKASNEARPQEADEGRADQIRGLENEIQQLRKEAEAEALVGKTALEVAERTDLEVEIQLKEIARLEAVCDRLYAEAKEAIVEADKARAESAEKHTQLTDKHRDLQHFEVACEHQQKAVRRAQDDAAYHRDRAASMDREKAALMDRTHSAELERDCLAERLRRIEDMDDADRESSIIENERQIQEIARLEAATETLKHEMNQAIDDAMDAERRAEDAKQAEVATRVESNEHARMSKAQARELALLLDRTAESKAEAAQVRQEVMEAVDRVANAENVACEAKANEQQIRKEHDDNLGKCNQLEAIVHCYSVGQSPDDYEEVLKSVPPATYKATAEQHIKACKSRPPIDDAAQVVDVRKQLDTAKDDLQKAEAKSTAMADELAAERTRLDEEARRAAQLDVHVNNYELSCQQLRENLRFEVDEVREAYALVDGHAAKTEQETAQLRAAHQRAEAAIQMHVDNFERAEADAEQARRDHVQATAQAEHATMHMQEAKDAEEHQRGKLHAKSQEVENLAGTCVRLRSEAASMWNDAARRHKDSEATISHLRWSEARALEDLQKKAEEAVGLTAAMAALRAEHANSQRHVKQANDKVSGWKREVAESRHAELTMAEMLQMKSSESEHLKLAQVSLRAHVAKLHTDMSLTNQDVPTMPSSNRSKALPTPHKLPKTVNGMQMLGDGGRTPSNNPPMGEQEAAMGQVLKALASRGCTSAAMAFSFFNPGSGKERSIPSKRMLAELIQMRILHPAQCDRFVQSLDPEDTGRIQYKTFRAAVASFLNSSSDFHAALPEDQYNAIMYRVATEIHRKGMTVNQVFKDWDYDRSGFVECQGFVAGLRTLKIGLADKEIVQIFNHLTGGNPNPGESPAISAASSARASSYHFGNAGGGRKLNLNEFEKLLRVHSEKHSKLKDWAEQQFTMMNGWVVEAAIRRYAEQPACRQLRFSGFKSLLNEAHPSLSSASIQKLWCVLPKDDFGEDPLVEVTELVRHLRPSGFGGSMAPPPPGPASVAHSEKHMGAATTPTGVSSDAQSYRTPSSMSDARKAHQYQNLHGIAEGPR